MKRLLLWLLLLVSFPVSAGTATLTLSPAQCSSVVTQCGSTTSAPTGCSATVNGGANAALPAIGGVVGLSVSGCTAASTITYSWYRNGNLGISTAPTWNDTLPANHTVTPVATTYQVQTCAGGACAVYPASTLTATVAAAGGGGWAGTCPGFAQTHVLTLNWSNPVRLYTSSVGGFGANEALVVVFTTGNVATSNNLPHVVAVEYQAAPYTRNATLSTTPCDFSAQPAPGANTTGNTVTMAFAITPGTGWSYYPVLNKNTTYYVNIKNDAGSGCTTGCNMSVDLLSTSGL